MKISYSKSLTVNLGDFNSARFDMSIEDEVEKGETKEEALARLKTYIDQEINIEYKKIIKLKGKL